MFKKLFRAISIYISREVTYEQVLLKLFLTSMTPFWLIIEIVQETTKLKWNCRFLGNGNPATVKMLKSSFFSPTPLFDLSLCRSGGRGGGVVLKSKSVLFIWKRLHKTRQKNHSCPFLVSLCAQKIFMKSLWKCTCPELHRKLLLTGKGSYGLAQWWGSLLTA